MSFILKTSPEISLEISGALRRLDDFEAVAERFEIGS